MFTFKYGADPVKIWDTREVDLYLVPEAKAPPPEPALDEAAEAAARLLREAEAEVQALRQRAAQEGWREGQAEGFEAGYRKGAAAAQAEAEARLACQLEAVDRLRETVREQMAEEVEEVVLTVLERFLDHLEPGESDRITGWVHEMLIEAAPHVASVIEVHPEDVGSVLAVRADWEDIHPAPLTIRVVPNPALRRGECRLLTDAGWLERSLAADDDLRQIVQGWARSATTAAWTQGGPEEADVDQRD